MGLNLIITPKKFSRTGPWNGVGFGGVLGVKANQIYDFNFVPNNDEVYIMYHMIKNSAITRVVLNQTKEDSGLLPLLGKIFGIMPLFQN